MEATAAERIDWKASVLKLSHYLRAVGLGLLLISVGKIFWSGLLRYITEVKELFIEKCAQKKELISDLTEITIKCIVRDGILYVLAMCGIIETSTCTRISSIGILFDGIQVVVVRSGYKMCGKNIAVAVAVFDRYTIIGLAWAIALALVGFVTYKLGESTSNVFFVMLSNVPNNNRGLLDV